MRAIYLYEIATGFFRRFFFGECGNEKKAGRMSREMIKQRRNIGKHAAKNLFSAENTGEEIKSITYS